LKYMCVLVSANTGRFSPPSDWPRSKGRAHHVSFRGSQRIGFG
jgi:hypothetical protein